LVISGAGADFTKLMGGESTTAANRLNGKKANSLESKNDFQSFFSKGAGKTEKASPKNPSSKNKSQSSGNLEEPASVKPDKEILVKSNNGVAPGQKTTGEKVEDIDSKKPQITAEESAMIKFLMSMKNELGVEPEQIVTAMISLDAQSLKQPPEETMQMVLQSLNLRPAQFERAEELYQNMLKDTAEASMGKMLSENNQTVDFAVVGPEEVRLQKLMRSLDDLNTSFFETKAEPFKTAKGNMTPGMSVEQSKETLAKLDQLFAQYNLSAQSASEESADAMPIDDLLAKLNVQGFDVASEAPQKSLATDLPTQKWTDQSINAPAQVISEATSKGSPEVLSKLEPTLDTQFQQNSSGQSATPQVAMPVANSAENKTDLMSSDDTADESLDKSADESVDTMPVTGMTQKTEILNTQNSARPGTPVIRGADDAANTRQLVETAQMLAQKGGGSMKIKLRPEGLGFVELKVGVNGGKVDIQMITENNEVKRLLEGGLSELKSGLVQHKLTLDNVQVDTSNKTNPGFDQMLGQGRDSAREFLEQFRQFNQNRREAGFDFGGVSSYASHNKRLRPEDVKYASAKSKANSRRLDLVA